MGPFETTVEKNFTEAKGRKPAFGSADKFNFAVQVNGLDSNDFFKQPFGRTLGDMKKVQKFKETAKVASVGAKGKATKAAVRAWVKENKPTQFFAKWQKDSTNWKDDSVEIHYTK